MDSGPSMPSPRSNHPPSEFGGISSGGNSGSQGTSLIIRALALRELQLRDWGWVFVREIFTGLVLGTLLGAIGFARIVI